MWEQFSEPGLVFREVSAVRAPRGGGLEVFAVADDGAVWQNASTATVDGWSGWSPFGRRPGRGGLLGGRSNPGLVSLGVNTSYDGRLRVFGAAPDGSAWWNVQLWGRGGWGGWLRFGTLADLRRRIGLLPDGWGRFGSSGALRAVVVPDPECGLMGVVFGLGVDDSVWVNVLDRWGWPELWRGWRQFGDPGMSLGSLAVGRPDDLRIELYGLRSSDGTLWRNTARLWALDPWTGWEAFAGPGDRFQAVVPLRTGGPDGSESDVFALDPDGAVWRHAPGATSWDRFGAQGDLFGSLVPVWGSGGGFATGLAGTDLDGVVRYAELQPSGQWSGFRSLGAPDAGLARLDVVSDLNLRLHAFGLDPQGAVWHEFQPTPGSWPVP